MLHCRIMFSNDLSGKEQDIQVSAGRVIISGFLGGVLVREPSWNARYEYIPYTLR